MGGGGGILPSPYTTRSNPGWEEGKGWVSERPPPLYDDVEMCGFCFWGGVRGGGDWHFHPDGYDVAVMSVDLRVQCP
jgi:hypothetical protein